MHRRHKEAPARDAEKGRKKGKGSEAGLGSRSPDTQVKEQRLSVVSLLKMKQRKHWRFVDNKQSRHVSV